MKIGETKTKRETNARGGKKNGGKPRNGGAKFTKNLETQEEEVDSQLILVRQKGRWEIKSIESGCD